MPQNRPVIKDANALKLFETIGLLAYFPGKITIQLARKNARTEVKHAADIPWYFIGTVLSVIDEKGWDHFDASGNSDDDDNEDDECGLMNFDDYDMTR